MGAEQLAGEDGGGGTHTVSQATQHSPSSEPRTAAARSGRNLGHRSSVSGSVTPVASPRLVSFFWDQEKWNPGEGAGRKPLSSELALSMLLSLQSVPPVLKEKRLLAEAERREAC